MRVVTALYNTIDRDYAMLMLNLKKSVEKNGYTFTHYLLDKDPIEIFRNKADYNTACFFKPHIIKKALQEFKEDVLWLDSDCLMQSPVDELLIGCDIAVTLRRFNIAKLRDIYDGYINAGVMAFKYNDNVLRLIDKWINICKNSRADQDAFNRILLDHTLLDQYGEIIDVDDVKIKIVDCDTYNYFYFEEETDKAKIYHCKGSLRPLYYDKIMKKVLGG